MTKINSIFFDDYEIKSNNFIFKIEGQQDVSNGKITIHKVKLYFDSNRYVVIIPHDIIDENWKAFLSILETEIIKNSKDIFLDLMNKTKEQ